VVLEGLKKAAYLIDLQLQKTTSNRRYPKTASKLKKE
jgi:hypothetical protein